MATLTEVSIISRKVIRYSVYAVILIIVGRFSFNIGEGIYEKIKPPKEEPPTVEFGKLPILPFPERSEVNLNYTLELPEGSLPVFPNKLDVYEMPSSESNIKTLDEAKTSAKGLGFNPDGKQLYETIPNVYIFSKNNAPSDLTMNIITGLFSVSYNINENPSVLSGIPPSSESAINQIKGFLKGGKSLTEDLQNGVSTTEYLKTESGKFISAVSLSDAQLTKVNLFRKPYGVNGDINAVTPEMPQANVWFIIAGGQGKPVITGEYHYFPIDNGKSGTYPIKTSDIAWEELKAGKAFLANTGDNPDGNIVIRKVYLAYYDAGQYAEYYQPVVVFEGDNNFYAYAPAVTDEFYGKEETE